MGYFPIIISIFIIIIMLIGFLTAYAIEKLHKEIELTQKSFHSMVEDFKVIVDDMVETNKLLEEYKLLLLQKYKNELKK